jgi:hypothetical protein
MYEHLNIGGKFILEIETIASVPTTCGKQCVGSHNTKDNSKITISTLPTYNKQTQIFRSICKYNLIKNNEIIETESEEFEQYLYKINEMDRYLKKFNFKQINKYANYSKEKNINEKTPIIIYECIK